MKIKKHLIPRREDGLKKKKRKTLTTNFESINPEKIFVQNILQKNSSLNSLKDKIQKESNNNIHDIFSSDESKLKAIKYVLHVSRGKENQKNKMNENPTNNVNNKKNLSFGSCDVQASDKSKNRIKVKRSQNSFYNKIEQLSPIKRDKFFNEDKPLNEEDLLRDNNISPNKKNLKFIYDDSPSTLLPSNQSYDINSQREIIPKNKYELNNNVGLNYTQNYFYENNPQKKDINPAIKTNTFFKINYIKKNNERTLDPKPDYNSQKIQTIDDNLRNKTIDNFYLCNQINKSELYNFKTNDNSINQYKNIQDKKNAFSNKNSCYDIKNNINDNYIHKKNFSHGGNYNNNFQIRKNDTNQFPFYQTEANSFYEPVINNNNNRMNYINNSKRLTYGENNNKNKNIIRLMGKNKELENSCNNNYYIRKSERIYPLKRKNNSFFINDTNINKPKTKALIETDFNNELSNTTYNFNNNYSFSKKIFPNMSFNYKTMPISINNENSIIINDNKEDITHKNLLSNKILVKKRPLKDNHSLEILNNNSNNKISPKNNLLVCKNSSFNFQSNMGNKIIFENENEIMDYIKNKFEEDKNNNQNKKLKYTGYVLLKKYNGKILHEIRIEDDLIKLNQKLKDENVCVKNELIEITTVNQNKELIQLKEKINNLEKEISKIKEENENLNKKDYLKNELIKKLEKEKQNILEENKKLCLNLNEIKQLNNNLNKQFKEMLNKNTIENILKQYEIENVLEMSIKNELNIENSDMQKLEKENIIINPTP